MPLKARPASGGRDGDGVHSSQLGRTNGCCADVTELENNRCCCGVRWDKDRALQLPRDAEDLYISGALGSNTHPLSAKAITGRGLGQDTEGRTEGPQPSQPRHCRRRWRRSHGYVTPPTAGDEQGEDER
jgi:hypothetical protein